MERIRKFERAVAKGINALTLAMIGLMLLMALALIIIGFSKSLTSVDTTIHAPTLTFQAYTNKLAMEKAAQDEADEKRDQEVIKNNQDSPISAPPVKQQPDILPQYEGVLMTIENSITSYAKKTDQPTPGEVLRRNVYLEAKDDFGNYKLTDDFLKKLSELAKNLDAAGDELSTLKESDPRKIFWPKFLDFMYGSYQDDLKEQESAISQAKEDAARKRGEAKKDYFLAILLVGSALILFLWCCLR